MAEVKEELEEEIWKKFLRKHWKMVLIAVGAIAGAVIGGIFVFLWFKDLAQATGLVPATLGAWTMGYGMTFFLNTLLYEFLIIGLPLIAVAIVVVFLWWKKLPDEEREEYKSDPKKKGSKRGRHVGGGGGVSFFVFIVWMIIVFANNMWNVPFQNWGLDYLITSVLLAWGLVALIGGIPLAIGAIWWLRRELKEPA